MKSTSDRLRQALEYPASDSGVAIQAVAARHARLLLLTNIWRRPTWWLRSLRKRIVIECYAVQMYARLVRRYGLSSPTPSDTAPCGPAWLNDHPITTSNGQETEDQVLARILYIASFLNELYFAGYCSTYVLAHVSQWNQRVIAEHEHFDEPPRPDKG